MAQLNAKEKKVMLALYHKRNSPPPTAAELAAELGLSKVDVERALSYLAHIGFVDRVEHH